jgi:hypothetical protein
MFGKLVRGLALLIALASPAVAGSTINTGVPATNAPLQSSVMRDNFAHAATDINNILGCFAGVSPPSSPSTFQYWCNTGAAPAQINQWDGGAWVTVGLLDLTAHQFTPYFGNPSLARTELGLGSMALQPSNNVSITGGSISGLSPALPLASGGTGATSFPAHAALLGNGTSTFGSAAPSAAGQCFLDNGASSNPSFQSCFYPSALAGPSHWYDTIQQRAVISSGLGGFQVTDPANTYNMFTVDLTGNTFFRPSTYPSGLLVVDNTTGQLRSNIARYFWVDSFGAVGNCATDDYTAINAAQTAAINAGGGYVMYGPKCYGTGTGILLNNSFVVHKGVAGGRAHHDGGTTPTSSALKWVGAGGGTMMTVAPVAGAGNQPLTGTGIESLSFLCNDSAAFGIVGKSFSTSLWRQLYVTGCTSWQVDLGVVSPLVEAINLQMNRFEQLTIDAGATSYGGMRLNGIVAGNVSYNSFPNLNIFHKDGTGLFLGFVDNNFGEPVTVTRYPGGTGVGVDFNGSSLGVSNGNHFKGGGAVSVVARGAGGANSLPIATFANTWEKLDTTNGVPVPTVESGAQMCYSLDTGARTCKGLSSTTTPGGQGVLLAGPAYQYANNQAIISAGSAGARILDPTNTFGLWTVDATGVMSLRTAVYGDGLLSVASGTVSSSPVGGIPTLREKLTGARTYYVRTDGNDTACTGLTNAAYSSGSFPQNCARATWQSAVNLAVGLDFNSFAVTIQQGTQAGTKTYSANLSVGAWVGGGSLSLVGDGTTTHLDAATGDTILVNNAGPVFISSMSLGATLGNTLKVADGTVLLASMDFRAAGGSHIWVHDRRAQVLILNTTNTVNGSAGFAHLDIVQGTLFFEGSTIALSGTPSFGTGFIYIDQNATAQINTASITGAATGARAVLRQGAKINGISGSPTFFPGNLPVDNIDGNYDGSISYPGLGLTASSAIAGPSIWYDGGASALTIAGGTGGINLNDNANSINTFRVTNAGVVNLYTGAYGAGALSVNGSGVMSSATLLGSLGGTGVANTGKTITLGGNLTTAGAASLPVIVQGDLWYGSASGVISALAKDAGASRFLKNSGTSNNPAWAQPAFTDLSGSVAAAQMPAFTGDITTSAGGVATTLATVNSNVGTFGSATQSVQFTVNGKGLITAAANATVTPAVGSITGLGTGVATALAVNVGSAGAFVTFNGALGTPSSGVGTNLTGTASGLTAGNVTTNANLTGPITSVGNATSIASQTGTGTKFVVDTQPTLTGGVAFASGSLVNGPSIGQAAGDPNKTTISGGTSGTQFNKNDNTAALSLLSNTGAWRWHTYGAGTLTTDASGNITATSDATLKNDRGEFTRSIADLRKIGRPHLYQWLSEMREHPDAINVGFFAQDVKRGIPEAVGRNGDGKLTLNRDGILAANTNAIMDLDDRLSAVEVAIRKAGRSRSHHAPH